MNCKKCGEYKIKGVSCYCATERRVQNQVIKMSKDMNKAIRNNLIEEYGIKSLPK